MKRIFYLMVLVTIVSVFLAACDSSFDAVEDRLDATGDAADTHGDAPSDVCNALGPLEASLDMLEEMDPGEHSVEDYQAQFEVIRQDFENLRSADTAGEYTADFDRFETAMAEFEEGLTSLLSGEGGILSGIFGLAEGAAELAVAGDILDEAIDCPGE